MQDEQTNDLTGQQNDSGNNDDSGQGLDVSALFSAEEISAKQEAVNAAKAEEDRRSSLSDEERNAEDKVIEDAKAAEEAASQGAPEEYADFKTPEGIQIDNELLNDFRPLAKELNLSQDKAQKIIDLYAGKITPALMKRQADAWQETLSGWVDACKSDKEIGGDKFDSKLLDAQRVINTEGTPELKKVFDQYGLGNNPEMVRIFSRMAKYMKEDNIENQGKQTESKGKSMEAIASRLYNGE
jgi:uncharacterized protein (DUF4415 family)